jgi:hypothetical protein
MAGSGWHPATFILVNAHNSHRVNRRVSARTPASLSDEPELVLARAPE